MPSSSARTDNIIPVSFADELGDRYLAYALSTITSRSLPDVRDGLKPVHRRLLYAMMQLKLNPEAGFKKCARVVGDVIGKYHPHGDAAVYDAMVRMAQSFALRYPLVDGQGNFGSIDGDNAAAMRYTEARMTEVARLMLRDIDRDTVDFQDTYDNQDTEPVVLPACFPNLLANGADGIAVGMATSIPPHNVGEICAALLALIDAPDGDDMQVALQHITAPDFPGGGVIAEEAATIHHAYTTGRGSLRVRARWEKEDLGHGTYQIIVTEIPYQVSKSRLIEKIAELFKERKLALLGNIRDESDENIRIVLEPKSRLVDADTLMESLFKLTELESRCNINLNALTASGVPMVHNLAQMLRAFLAHRREVTVRAAQWRLSKIDARLEIVDGLLIAYANLDEIIAIIREEDEPKPLLKERFSLTDVQAEAILNMRLRQLRKLEEGALKKEKSELSKERKTLRALIKEEALQWQAVAQDIVEIRGQFGKDTEQGARRTDITHAPKGGEIAIEAFIEKEPITVICSRLGWVRALKGHQVETEALKYKDGDGERFILRAHTTDKLLVFTASGRFFTLQAGAMPRGKGHGEAIRLMMDMDADDDICDMLVYRAGERLLVASNIGKGFIVASDDLLAQTRSGKQVLNPASERGIDGRAAMLRVIDGDSVAILGENRKLLVFGVDQIPQMKRGQGVRLQKYKQGGIADIKIFNMDDGLSWSLGERTRLEKDLLQWQGNRGQTGRMPPTGFPRKNRF